MEKSLCLYFQVHQPDRLRLYRFFDIGNDSQYFDEFANRTILKRIAQRCYLPMNELIYELIQKHGKNFKVAFSISGAALEQFEQYAPEVLESFKKLASTKCVEFLAETYSHSLASLKSEKEFKNQVKEHSAAIKKHFGVKPKTFRNTELIYSDTIGEAVAAMGFNTMLTEGAKHILGWKSPHYLYHCNMAPKLKVLLRDYKLSDDISLRFSNPAWEEYPLMCDTYMDWIKDMPEEDGIYNIFMELCALGIYQPLSSNILDFIKAMPECAKQRGITFSTPSEIIKSHDSVAPLDVPYPMSWNDEERDISCWLGNVMQREAFEKLYSIGERVRLTGDKHLLQDWDYLQASNNFRFMTTKNNNVSMDRGIYESPYDAFTNYMNILGDFMARVRWALPQDMEIEELNAFQTTIRNQDKKIQSLEKQVARLKSANSKKKK